MDTTPEQRRPPHDGLAAGGARDDAATPEPERLQLLLCRIGRELFAIDLAVVEEAVDVTPVQRVPDMPEAMLGVCDVRGSLVPVYSPARALRATPAVTRAEERIMLLMRVGGRRVGVTVDDVEDVLALDPGSLRHATLPGAADGVVLGIARIGRDLAAVLDASALLAACGAASPEQASTEGASASLPEAA